MIELTQEQRDLLFKDLSARLSYGVIANIPLTENDNRVYKVTINWLKDFIDNNLVIIPYLRPMSSMTEEDLISLKKYSELEYDQLELVDWQDNTKTLEFWLEEIPQYVVIKVFDWFNAHHFDYRGLIPMGLALPAIEGMYNAKN